MTARIKAPPAAPPPVTIDVAEPCASWRAALPDAASIAARAAAAALAEAASGTGAAELSLVLADDAMLRDLNRRFRNQDKPTNVLSFPAAGAVPGPGPALGPAPMILLGDVVLAFETVAREATAQGKSLADHLAHLVVHGVLHLLGHDHGDAAEAARMESREIAILAALGISDPYLVREVGHG